MVVRAVRRPRRLERVQGLSDRALPDRVDVHLEPLGVQAGDGRLQLLGLDERRPAVVGGPALGVQVGLEDGGGEVLDHAVLHDLDRRGREPPDPAPLARREQVLDLLDPPVPVPPQRAHDPRGQLPGGGDLPVGVEGRIAAADDRVLPRRDPERMQVALRGEEPFDPIRRLRLGDVPLDEDERALVHGARGFARRVADDPPVRRVGRVARHARDLERAGVHPSAVTVPAHQEHRPIRHHAIEDVLRRVAAREDVHRPPAADDPRFLRVRRRVLGDDPLVLPHVVGLGEVAVQHLEAAGRRVDVRVLEPGHEQPPGEIHHLGPRADQLAHIAVGPDRHDLTLPRPRPRRPSAARRPSWRRARSRTRGRRCRSEPCVVPLPVGASGRRSAQSITTDPRTMLRRPWRADDGCARARWASPWRWARSWPRRGRRGRPRSSRSTSP